MKRNKQKLVLSRRAVRDLDAARGGFGGLGGGFPTGGTGFPTDIPTLTDIRETIATLTGGRPDPPMSAGDTECPPCPEPGSFQETLCQKQTECIPCETEYKPWSGCCV
jgi:hypothetical protein